MVPATPRVRRRSWRDRVRTALGPEPPHEQVGLGRSDELHAWEIDHHHGPMGDPSRAVGNGMLLWSEVDDFDAAVARARELDAPILLDVHRNPNANHRELWIRDPDGYTVVLASPDGDAKEA